MSERRKSDTIPLGSWVTFCSLAIVIAKMLLRGIDRSGVWLFSGGFRCIARDFIAFVAYPRLAALMCVIVTTVGTLITELGARKTAGLISTIISSTT